MTEFICGDCGSMGEEPSLFEVPGGQYEGDSKLAVKFAKKTQMGYAGCPDCQSPNIYFDIPEEDEELEDESDEEEGEDEIDLDEVDEDVSLYIEDADVEVVKKKKKKKRKKTVVSADEPEQPRRKKKVKKKRKKASAPSGESPEQQLAPVGKKVYSPLAGLSEGEVHEAGHVVPQEVDPAVAAASLCGEVLGNVTRRPTRPKRMFRRECNDCNDRFETKHTDVLLCKRCLRGFAKGRR